MHVFSVLGYGHTAQSCSRGMLVFAPVTSHVLISISINICHGLPFITYPDSPYHYTTSEAQRALSPSHMYKYALHQVLTDAVASILRMVDMKSANAADLLDASIEMFDARALKITQPGDESSKFASDLKFSTS